MAPARCFARLTCDLTASASIDAAVNGEEFGPFGSFDTNIAFSPDGTHWACGIQELNSSFAVVLDGEKKPSLRFNSGDYLTFSSDSKRLLLRTERDGAKVEVDCFTGTSEDQILQSDDGKHTAYISVRRDTGMHINLDGTEGPAFRFISDLAMSPDGLHVAYVAQDTSGSYFVVIDGMKRGRRSKKFRADPPPHLVSKSGFYLTAHCILSSNRRQHFPM
jgi:hypothetical protein